jgi:hypothetical protein
VDQEAEDRQERAVRGVSEALLAARNDPDEVVLTRFVVIAEWANADAQRSLSFWLGPEDHSVEDWDAAGLVWKFLDWLDDPDEVD